MRRSSANFGIISIPLRSREHARGAVFHYGESVCFARTSSDRNARVRREAYAEVFVLANVGLMGSLRGSPILARTWQMTATSLWSHLPVFPQGSLGGGTARCTKCILRLRWLCGGASEFGCTIRLRVEFDRECVKMLSLVCPKTDHPCFGPHTFDSTGTPLDPRRRTRSPSLSGMRRETLFRGVYILPSTSSFSRSAAIPALLTFQQAQPA